ncbi:MAG: RagB/SusD family nutrient uptake outer membrane protein [Gemmataceae bacterium]|nr:RagB/SusD family nutrient uptake outer membrane protein [Gemmataceae bacterium]
MKKLLIPILAAVSLTFLSGCNQSDCGCSKPGGGGHSQSYDCGTGRYKLAIVGLAALLGAAAGAALRR